MLLAAVAGLFARPVRAHHVAVVVAAKPLAHALGLAGGAGSSAGVGAAVGGGAVIVLIAADVKHRFRCSWRRSTWTDGRNDLYPTYRPYIDECKRVVKRVKRRVIDPNTVRARG